MSEYDRISEVLPFRSAEQGDLWQALYGGKRIERLTKAELRELLGDALLLAVQLTSMAYGDAYAKGHGAEQLRAITGRMR